MSPRQYLPKIRQLIATALSVVAALSVTDALAQQPETPEIIFSTSDAQPLADTAAQLGNAVAIYEYVRNHFDYAAYHGSRSGSINTFLGQRGSDVDIATTLIAMLRSQNIPARYAVGTVRIPSVQLTNWLGVGNPDVAVQILKDQGIQGVVLAADRSTIDLEHVWTEALVPFSQYRGLPTGTSVDCTLAANSSQCNWIPLDGSFKQKAYNDLNIDPYNALNFDYTGYYNAIKDAETDPLLRKDKNPLTILEEQIATWLRANHPGKTLEDVADAGRIIETRDGLLPASLPFSVISTIRRYDSVALHDAAVPTDEPKTWDKTITVTQNMCPPGGAPISMGSATMSLVEVATRRLTSVLEINADGSIIEQVWRLGGEKIGGGYINVSGGGGSIVYGCSDGSSKSPQLGMPYWISVEMDGAPGATSSDTDKTISASYSAVIGGYYLVATGGESSNWSQVHRAADQLLTDNFNYKVVFNPADPGSNGQACDFASGLNCTPYVDATGNGWDASDLPLLQDKPALDALTGGLLYVAATQYYAKQREQFERADQLMKTKTPIIGFLGVVSSVYDVEYIDGTAFSVLPGGLLIDMKGITIGGSYRAHDVTLSHSNRQFEFLGHITSSLEHETWQELTGYDAVSTVRGIQMALASGSTLINPKKNVIEDTLPGLYSTFGFSASLPAGFTDHPLTVYSTAPMTWLHTVNGSQFNTLLATIDSGTNATQGKLATYIYSANNGLYGWSDCVDFREGQLQDFYNANGNQSIASISLCNQTFSGPVLTVISQFQSYWLNTVIPSYIGQTYFDYFDRNKGFTATGRLYRAFPPAADAYDALTVANIRNDLYLRDNAQTWVEYLMPSTLVAGPSNHFEVKIRKAYTTPSGALSSVSFEILNRGH
ncbi:transglutaminase-like domain-containing protein [Methylomonas methanica]|uniref:Transglutaminase domain-containing protein n=1 Tax=Methylomonas methanica (strain DSM 25384 / MC09) TaxID=857087 RepID=F9ZZ04_METMM|nr:transglutaminase domain-containing protein [Methylomonas methanica]AEF99859.1 transglutaminase domain-containing protein [Methylomonas methanica MC09]